MEWDVFISHASEDKDDVARPLAEELTDRGYHVWYDQMTLQLGDSLRRSIDDGLARSRYGVVILSHSFFAKEWPKRELDGLTAREIDGSKIILPVWHNITQQEVAAYSPVLADRKSVDTANGVSPVADAIENVLAKSGTPIAIPSVDHERRSHVDYEVLREWRPMNIPTAYGADLLMNDRSLSEDDLIAFLRRFFERADDPMIVRVFTSREKYRTDEGDGSILVFCVRNRGARGPYAGSNEIRWMQEHDKFADKFGLRTQL